MDGFNDHLAALQALGASVIAASAEPEDKASELAAGLAFPVAHGVTRAQADSLGAWWEDRRQIIQPSDFVLGGDGTVLSATYSTGPIGRLEAADAVRFIEFQEQRRLASA